MAGALLVRGRNHLLSSAPRRLDGRLALETPGSLLCSGVLAERAKRAERAPSASPQGDAFRIVAGDGARRNRPSSPRHTVASWAAHRTARQPGGIDSAPDR